MHPDLLIAQRAAMMPGMTMNAQTGYDERLEFDLADRMRRALRVSGVSVEEIADYLGVARGTVSTWINGRIVPRKSTMRLFALKTGVPLEWLETGAQGEPTGPVGPAGIEPTTSTV
jgi:DNA-binding transcriptional regulator YiaG